MKIEFAAYPFELSFLGNMYDVTPSALFPIIVVKLIRLLLVSNSE